MPWADFERRCRTVGCANFGHTSHDGLCLGCWYERLDGDEPCAADGCFNRRYCAGLCVAHWRKETMREARDDVQERVTSERRPLSFEEMRSIAVCEAIWKLDTGCQGRE
jgi:hypothetical protein